MPRHDVEDRIQIFFSLRKSNLNSGHRPSTVQNLWDSNPKLCVADGQNSNSNCSTQKKDILISFFTSCQAKTKNALSHDILDLGTLFKA